jgi:hypothetical protein
MFLNIFKFFHDELMPRLLVLLEDASGLNNNELLKAHTASSEVGHFLVYSKNEKLHYSTN